jgi:hypothetical protein
MNTAPMAQMPMQQQQVQQQQPPMQQQPMQQQPPMQQQQSMQQQQQTSMQQAQMATTSNPQQQQMKSLPIRAYLDQTVVPILLEGKNDTRAGSLLLHQTTILSLKSKRYLSLIKACRNWSRNVLTIRLNGWRPTCCRMIPSVLAPIHRPLYRHPVILAWGCR